MKAITKPIGRIVEKTLAQLGEIHVEHHHHEQEQHRHRAT